MTFDNAVIDIAYIVDDYPEKGYVIVELEEGGPTSPENEIRARLINPLNNTEVLPPKKGAKGLLIRRNKDNQFQSFWVGTISEPSSTPNDKDSEGVQFRHNKSKLKLGDSEFIAKTNRGMIHQDNKNFRVVQGISEMNLNNDEGFIAIKDDKDINRTVGLLSTKKNGNTLFSQGDTMIESGKKISIKSHTGGVFIHGKNKATSDDKTLKDMYEPIDKFFMTTNDASLFSTGSINFSANKMLIDLGTATLTGDMPGIGPAETFELNVLKGDVVTNLVMGNFEVNNINMGLTGKIKLHVGDLLSPGTIVNSDLTMAFHKTELRQTTIPFLTESGLILTKGKATLDSNLGTDIISDANINIKSSKLSVMIKSLLKAAIDSATIEITSTIKTVIESKMINIIAPMIKIEGQLTKVKGMMLDLKEAKTIDAGPKTVAPTGSGPFCAKPICTWDGTPHIGDKAVG